MTYPHVYVHVPFCARRCSYCDFSIAVRRVVPVARFNDAIMAELATRGVDLRAGELRSLYLGGGTPSQLGGVGVARLVHEILAQAGVENSSTRDRIEVTIEANPEDVTAEAATAWQSAGINRVSIGAQSFDPGVLRWMHRGHGPERVGEAVRQLRDAGIADVSLDLIFAVPADLGRSWERDVALALELDPTHLSVYGLTVEPRTPLGRWRDRGAVAEAPEERFEQEFLLAHETLTAAGFDHYEVSNYGRPGRHSRHNGAYWSGAPYLGLGPSAHGFDGRSRRWNTAPFAGWLEAVEGGRDPVSGEEIIGKAEASDEAVYLGLRTAHGLSVRENELETVTPWIARGWGELLEGRLRLTPLGWLRLDAIAAALTSLRSRS